MVLGPSTVARTSSGTFMLSHISSGVHEGIAIHVGDLGKPGTHVRIHSSCVFSEALSTVDCDCRLQLTASLDLIQAEERGVVVYLFQEGRGQGLANKIRGMALMYDEGCTTAQAYDALHLERDIRDYGLAVQTLRDLGVATQISLMTNNPRKTVALRAGGFSIARHVDLTYPVNDICYDYLVSKRDELGHRIQFLDECRVAESASQANR
jgi:3,4-dihydroxy 2-butanone 4-phosphate synthase/GTP cyclohydrolase II